MIHKEKEAISGGKKKSGKTIKFDGETKDFNTMVSHDAPISKKKKGKNQAKSTKSENDTVAPSEEGNTCGIGCLNLGEPAKKSESDSESEK